MKKLLINIENNSLIFSIKRNQVIREDLMNTNIISDSELVFSDDYLLENIKIVIPFFKELCSMNQIDSLVFQSSDLALFMIDYFRSIKIKKIKVKKEENISYALCEKLILNRNIRELDCYSIANFLFEYLDKHNIKVTTHSEVFYVSDFMQENGLTDYSKMFYKKSIKIDHSLTDEDKDDINSFLRLNHYLKVISLAEYHPKDIVFLLESLKAAHLRGVLIQIYENITKPDDILLLKGLNKQYKKNHYMLDLVYSNEYLKDNLMKQITLNTLRLCTVFIMVLLVGTLGYIGIRNYKAMQEVSEIQDTVQNTIANASDEDVPQVNDNFIVQNKYIASLLSINSDVVGYLKVNNTSIDYPVVKATDNKYYLKYNLYKQADQNGWVFMDFRNSDKILNSNTIIYGHNMYYSGVMFGTLHKVLYSSWYNNPDNLTIQFDTMYQSMKWQIISIYTIPKTSDYLKVVFDTDQEYQDYINMILGRSIKNFGVPVTTSDHILTLSTCTGDTDRLVVHAKLMDSKDI